MGFKLSSFKRVQACRGAGVRGSFREGPCLYSRGLGC